MNMNTARRIYEEVQHLPESAQQTVLDFIENLTLSLRQKDHDWAAWSLRAASRGMEDDLWLEDEEADFKEKWQ